MIATPPIVGVPRFRGGSRPVLADLLTEALPGEDPDQVRGEQDRDRQRHAGGDEDLLSRGGAPARRPASASASSVGATRSSPAARDALTSTTSPGPSSARSSSSAASTSATRSDSAPQDPSRRAPWCRRSASDPRRSAVTHRAARPAGRSRRARPRRRRRARPSRPAPPRCGASAGPRPMVASACSAALIESGLAL